MLSIYDVIALILKEEGCDLICPIGSRLYKKKGLTTSLNCVVILNRLALCGIVLYLLREEICLLKEMEIA